MVHTPDTARGSIGESRRPRARPLAWHLVLLCLVLGVPILTLAAALAYRYVSTERARLEAIGLQTARNVASVLHLELTELTDMAKVLARSAAVVSGDPNRIADRAQEVRQIGVALMVYDRNGHPLAGALRSADETSDLVPDQALLQATRPVVSDLTTGSLLPGPVIRITTPVRRDQDIVGFLGIEIPAALLSAKAIQAPAGGGWTVAVADRQGTIVAASVKQAEFVGRPMLPALWAAVTQGRNGVVQEPPGRHLDDAVIVASSRVQSVGWTAVVTASGDVAEVPVSQSVIFLSMLAIALIVLSATLGLLFARRIAKPVVGLAAEAARLGRGETLRPLASTVSEIDFVAQALAEACAQRGAMERQLRESESRFRTMFEAAPVAVAVLDSETLHIIACNTLACEHLGYTSAELIGHRISDFDVVLSENDLRDITRTLDDATSRHEFETQHRTRTGEVRDVLVRAVRVQQGKRPQSYAAWIDITSRRAQDREMARMIDLQRAVLDALPAHIALLDAEARIVVVNEAWRQFADANHAAPDTVGVGADYLAACQPAVAAGDPTVAAIVDGLKGILAGRRDRVALVYPCHTPDGAERWFHFIAAPDARKRPAGVFGGGAVVMHLDITQRVLAERALAESEARQRLFIERVPAPIAVFDIEMRYLAVSRRFLTDYRLDHAGAGPTTIVGRSHYDLFLNQPEPWRDIHHRILIDGETMSVDEDRLVLADGRTEWVRWEMTPWRRQCGTIGGAVLFTELITERKNAEAALRASEARVRLAIEAAGLGTWDEDIVAGTSIWNETSYRILGLQPSEQPIHPDLWRERIHPEDREEVERAYAAALSSDELYQCEHRIVRPNGEIRWIRPLGRCMRNAEGTPVRFIGVFNDITDLKQSSSAQERLLQLIEQSTDLIATANPDGWITYLNRSGREIIGVDEAADITRLHFTDYVAPASQHLFRTTAIPAARDSGRWEGEMQLIHLRTGSLIDVHRSIVALRDNHGALAGYATVTRDITAAKRSETALAEREALLRSILETVPDGMVLFDEHGTIQSFSAMAEHLFGWLAPEAVGCNVSMLLPKTEQKRLARYLASYPGVGERRLLGVGQLSAGQRKDGSIFPAELSVGELRFDGRRLFTGFIRDLTERQDTQARLQHQQVELAHLSRLSTAGAMASALAHELNQPLTAITSAVRAARRMIMAADIGPVAPSLWEAVDLAAEQALRAGQIIRRLREFVARGGDAEKRLESLPQLVEEASALALLGTKEKGVRVVFRIPAGLPLLLVDRVQIQQVLINLMRNAVQAMTEQDLSDEAHTRQLTVSASQLNADHVELAVADTGPGLAPHVAGHLFEPFVTTKEGGMGLGLSICRSIVEAHGGSIWAETDPEGGVVFRFTLQTVSSNFPLAEEC